MKAILFSLLVSTTITSRCFGQQTKINFQSKQSQGLTVNKKRLLILWENVVFKNNKSTMYCDSATYDRTNNSFVAYNNIKIIENDSLELFGDSLHYFGDEQKALIYGNVRVITQDIYIETPSLTFLQKEKTAYYFQTGTINQKSEGYTINSQEGIFKTKINTIFFKKNVKLNHPEYDIFSDTLIYNTELQNTKIIGKTKISTKNSIINCEKGWFDNISNKSSLKGNVNIKSDNHTLFADSIYYDEKSGISYAEGNVKIVEDSNNIIIEGNYGHHNENSDSTRIWDNSSLTQGDSSETLKIYADQFIKVNDSLSDKIFCFNNVIIDGTQIQGDCDSIYYNETDSIMKCIVQPILWVDNNQITGENIELKLHNGIIYKLYVKNNSMIINQKDSIHYDQTKGDFIEGFFKENKMWLMKIDGKGKVLYYSTDSKDSLVTELNDISCDNMDIYFKDKLVNKINFKSKPIGKTEPVKFNEKGKILDDFFIYPKRTYLEKLNEANGDLLKGK